MSFDWTREAMADIRSLRRFLDERDPKAARRAIASIVSAIATGLSENPMLGHPGRVPGTRELVIAKSNYIVPYRVQLGRIQILRVYHHAQRWPDRM